MGEQTYIIIDLDTAQLTTCVLRIREAICF